MRWSTPALVGFIEHAGWQGNDTIVATAVALATSQGDDTYCFTPTGQAKDSEVGLFGLEADASFLGGLVDYFQPQRNADAAYAIWSALDGSWSWSPVWSAGSWRQYLDLVAAVVASGARGETDGNLNAQAERIDAAHATLAASIDTAGRVGALRKWARSKAS